MYFSTNGGKLLKLFENLLSTSKINGETVFTNSVIIPDEQPEKVKIVPVGQFPNHPNGGHTITLETLNQMKKNIEQKGMDILFDYGHESLFNPKALAAGWSLYTNAEVKEDGLYISAPFFTERARNLIRAGEYKYFSPAYRLTGKDKNGNTKGAELLSIGLTNTPYFDKEISHIKNWKEEFTMNEEISRFFGSEAGCTQNDIINKINEIKREFGFDEETNLKEILNSFSEVSATEFDRQTGKLLEETILNNSSNVSELIENAIKGGKIFPSEKELWQSYAEKNYTNAVEMLKRKEKVIEDMVLPLQNRSINLLDEAAEFIKSKKNNN